VGDLRISLPPRLGYGSGSRHPRVTNNVEVANRGITGVRFGMPNLANPRRGLSPGDLPGCEWFSIDLMGQGAVRFVVEGDGTDAERSLRTQKQGVFKDELIRSPDRGRRLRR
jgi:hypothetical protein